MITKLTNANAYLNGQTLIGKVSEVDLPDIKLKMIDMKPLGLMSEVEVPSGIEKMDVKIKWHAFFLKEFLQLSNFASVNNITIRGNQEGTNSLGTFVNEPVMITINGISKKIPLGKYKQNELVDLETEMSVRSLSLVVNLIPLINIDILTNTYFVGNLDLLLPFKINT